MVLPSGVENNFLEKYSTALRVSTACGPPAGRQCGWMTSQLRPSAAARNVRCGRCRSAARRCRADSRKTAPRPPRSSGGPRPSWSPWPTSTASSNHPARPVTAPHRSQPKPRSTRRSRAGYGARCCWRARTVLLDGCCSPSYPTTTCRSGSRSRCPCWPWPPGSDARAPGTTRARPAPVRAPATVGGWCRTAPGSPTRPDGDIAVVIEPARPVKMAELILLDHGRTTRSARSPAWSCRAFYHRDPPPPCACRCTPCRTTSRPSSWPASAPCLHRPDPSEPRRTRPGRASESVYPRRHAGQRHALNPTTHPRRSTPRNQDQLTLYSRIRVRGVGRPDRGAQPDCCGTVAERRHAAVRHRAGAGQLP